MKKLSLLLIPLFWLGCTNNGTNDIALGDSNDETAQQVGDVMASIDESGGSGGEIALHKSIEKTFNRLAPQDVKGQKWTDLIIQPAMAASCFLPSTFGACDTNTVTRTFDGCKIGAATFNGTVTLIWDGGSVTGCTLGAAGDSITRVPDFTVTGLRGATLTVQKTGAFGQNMTWASGSGDTKVFNYTNDGIQRKFTKGSTTLFDFTTTTTSAITVTGALRTNRVINGGELNIANNKTGDSCTYTPEDVTWSSASCNCPVSGTWTGTCTGGKTTKVEITACGKATVTINDETGTVSFDRCLKVD